MRARKKEAPPTLTASRGRIDERRLRSLSTNTLAIASNCSRRNPIFRRSKPSSWLVKLTGLWTACAGRSLSARLYLLSGGVSASAPGDDGGRLRKSESECSPNLSMSFCLWGSGGGTFVNSNDLTRSQLWVR